MFMWQTDGGPSSLPVVVVQFDWRLAKRADENLVRQDELDLDICYFFSFFKLDH